MGGKRWSATEEIVLAQIAREGLHLIDGMDRLPRRTYEAAKIFASKKGITFSASIPWSKDERALLRQIYRGKESIKAGVHRLLPNRSYISAKGEAQVLGLSGTKKRTGRTGMSWVERAVEMTLENHDLLTTREIVEKTGASVSAVDRVMRRLHGKKAHIGGWTRPFGNGDYAARWAHGGGPDAPRPPRKSAKDACRAWRMKQQIRAGQVHPFATLIHQVAA